MSTIHLEYKPRQHQIEIHKNLKRFNVLICHRRFGKTILCINQLIHKALKNELKNPRYAYIAPLYKQSKTIAWDYLKEYTRVIPGMKYNESELRADFPNGARITLYGADNYDSLRGIYLDGCVLDEYAQMDPRAWTEVVRPALADRKGWAIFIGTPQGRNKFYELYQFAKSQDDWYSAMFRASETGIVDKKELDDARAEMGDNEYQQEFECSFEAAIKGAVYGDEMRIAREQNRICKVQHDERLPVWCINDPGDAIWAIGFFQVVGREKRWIDSAEFFKPSDEEVATFIKSKPYNYEKVMLPFDATVQRRDIGKSLVQHFRELGVPNIDTIPQQKSKDSGIRMVKTIFPDLWINDSTEEMQHAIECVVQYHYKINEISQSYRSSPEHDWASHISDMLRYFALACDMNRPVIVKSKKTKPQGGWQGKMIGRR